MAGPTGIEPATYGLRVRCSALLSYGPTYFKKENRLRNIELAVLDSEGSNHLIYFSMSGLSLAMPSTPFFLYSATSLGSFIVQTITFKPFS